MEMIHIFILIIIGNYVYFDVIPCSKLYGTSWIFNVIRYSWWCIDVIRLHHWHGMRNHLKNNVISLWKILFGHWNWCHWITIKRTIENELANYFDSDIVWVGNLNWRNTHGILNSNTSSQKHKFHLHKQQR